MKSDTVRLKLLGELQEQTLDLDTIHEVGDAIFENRDHLQLFGMRPDQYSKLGISITGRTAIECVSDADARSIATAVAQVLRQTKIQAEPIVLDLFAGSGNLLFHVATHLNTTRNIGLESNKVIFTHLKNNFAQIRFPALLENDHFEASLQKINLPSNQPLVAIIDPPWEDAFSFRHGLNLQATHPPISQVMQFIGQTVPSPEVFCVVKTFELMNEKAAAEAFRGSTVCYRAVSTYMKPGMNVGWIICHLHNETRRKTELPNPANLRNDRPQIS